MKRLTISSETIEGFTLKALCGFARGGSIDDEDSCKDCCDINKSDCEKCPIQVAFNRLAEYENTGLMPEEVMRLKEENENGT